MKDIDAFNNILNDNPSVTEETFRTRYFPLLENMDTPKKRDEYLKLAGNAFMRVNVIDSDGNVLFWVPPLEQRPSINANGVDFYEVVVEAERKRGIHPAKGEAFAKRMLSNRIGNAEMSDEDRMQWRMIFEKYGTGISGTKVKLPEETVYEEW